MAQSRALQCQERCLHGKLRSRYPRHSSCSFGRHTRQNSLQRPSILTQTGGRHRLSVKRWNDHRVRHITSSSGRRRRWCERLKCWS
jgi:hypothetical protein